MPGLYLWGLLTPPTCGRDNLAALVAKFFRGAFPPVDFYITTVMRTIQTAREKKIKALVSNHLSCRLFCSCLCFAQQHKILDMWIEYSV